MKKINEEKVKLRIESLRLLQCSTQKDIIDLIDIFLKYLFIIIKNHQKDPVNSMDEAEAKIINQMIFTKIAHLKEILNGFEYSYDNSHLKNIIDPTIIATNIRSIYEQVALFNLIFVNTKSEDERKILYNLWVISGLKYRQKFEELARTPENLEKFENEKKQIENQIAEIKNTTLYKSLDERNQKKIDTKIKEKDYKIRFNDNNVEFLNWQDLTKTLGLKLTILDSIYNYFSLYAHPTNVAVFQFTEMFKKQENWIELANFNVRNALILTSMFIADYITLFPQIRETFDGFSIQEQIAMNWMNVFARGEEYSINDCLDNIK